jgi:6-phosphogluconate dehydrogenase
MSTYKDEREQAARIITGPSESIDENKNNFINKLKSAMYFSMIVTYAQGMAQLRSASEKYSYNLNLKDVAKIWRGGCIIRAALLEDIYKAFEKIPDLPNLLVDQAVLKEILTRQEDIRYVVNTAVSKGIPVPGLSASIAYFDSYRSGRLPANLIQAQRDYFGSHTYSRIDEKGTYHTKWNQW